MPDAAEVGHMGHPDFRAGGKIFATLGYPDAGFGMVKLTPEQQAAFVDTEPEVFAPVKGYWGARGGTLVSLRAASAPVVRQALETAWRNVAPKGLSEKPPARAKKATRATRRARAKKR